MKITIIFQGIEAVFGRTGFPGNRSPVTNQLWNGLRLGQEMGISSGFAKEYENVKCMELDEMHRSVVSKKTAVGSGLPPADLESGLSRLSA